MARGKKQPPREPEKTAAEFYHLHTQAVEDLVTADESNSPPVSREELRKYQRRRIHLSDWLKAVLLKAWFGGVVCYFIIWGLGVYIPNQLDLIVVAAVALGLVKDLLENNVFRFYAEKPGENDRWMMFPAKRFVTLPLNILYALLLVWCVVRTYDTINLVWTGLRGKGALILGVGPILFGLFIAGWDLLFLAVKRGAGRILEDAKQKAGARKT